MSAAPDTQRRSGGGPDPDKCGVRWCDEVDGHGGPHRRYLLDLDGIDPDTWRPVIAQLVMQGESARVRALVLVTDTTETALTWSQVDRLAAALVAARRSYAA